MNSREFEKNRNQFRMWIVVIVILVFILAAISININTVTVRGNETYSAEEITRLMFPDQKSRNTGIFIIEKLLGKKKTIPFIADYDIGLRTPTQAEIIVYEKNPVGCIVYMSQYMYFDKEGMIIESSEDRIQDVPEIKGIKFGSVVIGKKLPTTDETLFNKVMNISQQLSSYNISCRSITFDNFKNISIELNDLDISVDLGTDEYLAVKLSVLNDMLPELLNRGLKGNLDLSNYNDKEKGGMSSFKVAK